jgi:hypothetical protein
MIAVPEAIDVPHLNYLPEEMGTATLTPDGPIEAGYATLIYTYTAGKFGIDDTQWRRYSAPLRSAVPLTFGSGLLEQPRDRRDVPHRNAAHGRARILIGKKAGELC